MWARYTIGDTKEEASHEAGLQVIVREGELPYQDWFETGICAHQIGSPFWGTETIDLSPLFKDFRRWLGDLRWLFAEGFRPEATNRTRRERPGRNRPRGDADSLVPFHDETLEGCIDYSTLIEPTRSLTGEAKRHVIRCDPHRLRPMRPKLMLGLVLVGTRRTSRLELEPTHVDIFMTTYT